MFLDSVTRVCAGDAARLRAVLAGLRRYQAAPAATPRPQRPVVARSGNVTLRDFGGNGPIAVFVPSLINPPTVLDLAPGNSLLDALAAVGIRAMLVDWGETEAAGLEAMTETRLVPLLEQIGEPVALAGYCLGGTLALAAAALLGPQVTRLALLAAPWHFSGYGEQRTGLADWWRDTAPLATSLGAVPMDLLQPAFWSLDPAGLAAKYARFGALPDGPEADAFAVLEDWSNTGQPLSIGAAQGLAETLFRDDASGRGTWAVGGQRIDPAALRIPILDVIAGRDRIVPPAAALTTAGPGTPLVIDAGHVGMVVGGRAPALLWEPLARWLRGDG
ncbi:MAG: alpha/beta hydrolase [Sandarakinorhabdus sp.]|nr:alpha/beta hydrolase [Sandarakinorhabdus sp.]